MAWSRVMTSLAFDWDADTGRCDCEPYSCRLLLLLAFASICALAITGVPVANLHSRFCLETDVLAFSERLLFGNCSGQPRERERALLHSVDAEHDEVAAS